MRAWQSRADVVVIGTGVAGLAAALAAHRRGRRVVVLSKAAETATFHAQGGIAVVLPRTEDSIDAHVHDTLSAGAGLCDPEAVRSIVSDGYRAVTELVSDGARFDEAAPGRWALTREGGHSRRRIIHAGGDATGAEVQRALDHAAATLDIRRNHVAQELLYDGDGITGVQVINGDGIGVVHAPAVILATGGLGHLYRATTNPEGSTGDGIALALRAGVPVSDIEFIQFHPTMLYAGRRVTGRRPLISEALRGEGAKLVDARGVSVMSGVHPMAELAPRDVVAAAIEARLRETGDRCVYLDARRDRWRRTQVPDCHRLVPRGRHRSTEGPDSGCARGALQLRRCGHRCRGRTELAGLFAAGEVARTGMHGANRLASNSLLEGLVVGGRAGRGAAAHAGTHGSVIAAAPERAPDTALRRKDLQRIMTVHASVVRDADGLTRLTQELQAAPPRARLSGADTEDVALTMTARAVVAGALARCETRGCHHRSDFPDTDSAQARSTTARQASDGRVLVDAPVPAGACG